MIETIISSSILILVIILLRFALRRRVKNSIIYALWLIVAIRLFIPFNLPESSMSIMNLQKQYASLVSDTSDFPIHSPMNTDNIIEESNKQNAYENTESNKSQAEFQNSRDTWKTQDSATKNQPLDWNKLLTIIWLSGMCGFLFWFFSVNCIFYAKLRKYRVKYKIKCTIPVYVVAGLDSPCIFGVIRPAIYLNRTAIKEKKRLNYIISHELYHCRHGDLIWSILRCFLVSVYWFHPLIWLGAYLSKQDCEYACDESVIKKCNYKQRVEYGKTLLALLSANHTPNIGTISTSMTSRGTHLKKRLTLIAKKPKISLSALIALISTLSIITGCTFTSASKTKLQNSVLQNNSSGVIKNIVPSNKKTTEEAQTTIPASTTYDLLTHIDSTTQTTGVIITYTTAAKNEEFNPETTKMSETTNYFLFNSTDDNAQEEKWDEKAQQLYKIAWHTYFSIVYNGSYFEANGNTSEKLGDSFCEVSDARASTVADVKSELRKVFSESYASQYDNQIEEIYKEVDGKLYQQERGKGGVLSLEDIDIEFVSADETQAKFHAVIHNPGSSNIRTTTPFTLIYENGDWKVSEFTDPDLT